MLIVDNSFNMCSFGFLLLLKLLVCGEHFKQRGPWTADHKLELCVCREEAEGGAGVEVGVGE